LLREKEDSENVFSSYGTDTSYKPVRDEYKINIMQ